MSRRSLVIAARTALIMLGIAAVALLALGAATLLLIDPPEVDGWLRAAFGKVFGVAAIGLGAVLGIPAAAGLWAMTGAGNDVEPALPRPARLGLVAVGIGTIALTGLVLVVDGSAAAVLNLGLLGLVGLSSLGLSGAVAFSPHRWRAAASGVALVVVAAGTVWVLNAAFIGTPATGA